MCIYCNGLSFLALQLVAVPGLVQVRTTWSIGQGVLCPHQSTVARTGGALVHIQGISFAGCGTAKLSQLVDASLNCMPIEPCK